MKIHSALKIILLTFWSIFWSSRASSCSMYKVSVNGKTMVGNNEDSWGRDARIWFEPATADKFGMMCLGYARKYPNPDGAVNEYGLVFDAFTMPHKANMPERDPKKKDFGYAHIRTIMQQCKTVEEVHTFLNSLNLHVLNGSIIFNGGMFLFVDKSGNYLVVEAGKMTFGSDDKFALANFSIADTKDLSTIKTERYCKGVRFLNNKAAITSLAYCTALSDTMSVNRVKVGDGTLYTSIYDLDEGLVHLYFFHDYNQVLSFNLKEELSKGPHSYSFAELFPHNTGFKKFLDYQTPQNNMTLLVYLLTCGMLFFFSFVYFLFNFFKSSKSTYPYLNAGLSLLSLALTLYVYVLLRNEGIYYFPSPYTDGRSILVSMTSYLPIILAVALLPLLSAWMKIVRKKEWSHFSRFLFTMNAVVYFFLIGLFVYWKLFDVFH